MVNAMRRNKHRTVFLPAGEVSCTGSARRQPSRQQFALEAIVFAHRSYLRIADLISSVEDDPLPIPPWDPRGATESDESVVVSHNWDEIRRCMWNYVGIVRSDKRLERAQRRIDLIIREIEEYYRNFIITRDLTGTAEHRRGRQTHRHLRPDAEGEPGASLQPRLPGKG